MEQRPTQKVICAKSFSGKNLEKFSGNTLGKLINSVYRNASSEFGPNANKLGELTPDIAVQIKNPPFRKDRFSRSPFKDILEIWPIKPRHQRGTLFPLD